MVLAILCLLFWTVINQVTGSQPPTECLNQTDMLLDDVSHILVKYKKNETTSPVFKDKVKILSAKIDNYIDNISMSKLRHRNSGRKTGRINKDLGFGLQSFFENVRKALADFAVEDVNKVDMVHYIHVF